MWYIDVCNYISLVHWPFNYHVVSFVSSNSFELMCILFGIRIVILLSLGYYLYGFFFPHLFTFNLYVCLDLMWVTHRQYVGGNLKNKNKNKNRAFSSLYWLPLWRKTPSLINLAWGFMVFSSLSKHTCSLGLCLCIPHTPSQSLPLHGCLQDLRCSIVFLCP